VATYVPKETEDAASSGGEDGVPIIAVRNDAAASKTSTDGDFSMLAVDSAGRVGVADLGGSVTVDTTGTSGLEVVQDTAADLNVTEASAADILTQLQNVIKEDDVDVHATGGSQYGVALMAVNTPNDASVNTDDYGTLSMSADRRLNTDANILVLNSDVVAGNPVFIRPTDGTSAQTFDAEDLDSGGGSARICVGIAGRASGGPQPINGTTADGLLVNLGGNNDVTVTGTVDLGATDNAVLDQIELNTDYGTTTGGGTESGALRVTIANDSTGVLSIDDGGGAITVDGAVTADLGSNNDVVVEGDVAHGDADSGGGGPVKVGFKAVTTTPTAVDDDDRVNALSDTLGRQVVSPHQLIDEQDDQVTTISNTSETTILAAGGAGVKNDLIAITVANSSTTSTLVTIRDGTAGTIRWYIEATAESTSGIVFPMPLRQASANVVWTAQAADSVSTLYVSVQAAQNV
jgi:hypothetical protein